MLVLWLSLCLTLNAALAQNRKNEKATVQAANLQRWLFYLASDELEGRATFSEGLGMATAYLADHLQQEKLGKGSRHPGLCVVPIIAPRRGRAIVAMQTSVAFWPQLQIDPAIEDWKMTQPDGLAIAVKLGRLLSALVADRVIIGRLNLDSHFLLGEFCVQDLNARKIQQLLDQLELLFGNWHRLTTGLSTIW
jgi:hypothetical protein